MEINLTPLEMAFFIVVSVGIYGWARHRKRIMRWLRGLRKRAGRRSWQLRPREPKDCPECAKLVEWLPLRARKEVVPWRERKSRAGRPKTIDSRGYACFNAGCDYYGITDPTVHALVSYGKRGERKDIRYWRCQACFRRKSSRYGTMMYRLKTPLQRVAMVMTAMGEGVDLSAASRIFGHHPKTIGRWVERGGLCGERLQQRLFFRALDVGHIQLDELVTKVRSEEGHIWVWTAIAAKSKVILAVHIGGRTIADACSLIHQVAERLAQGCLPVFTSDGLNQYFYGLTAHFGYWGKPSRARKHHWHPDENLQYAQMRKQRSGRKVRFLYSIVRLGEREVIRALLLALDLTARIQTAFIERSNLTLRELVAPLSRRTWSIAYDRHHLHLHIQWGLTYYHLARAHQSLRVPIRGPSRYRHRTPAMAAGVTRRRWTVAELLMMPAPKGGWLEPFPVA